MGDLQSIAILALIALGSVFGLSSKIKGFLNRKKAEGALDDAKDDLDAASGKVKDDLDQTGEAIADAKEKLEESQKGLEALDEEAEKEVKDIIAEQDKNEAVLDTVDGISEGASKDELEDDIARKLLERENSSNTES